MDINQVDIKDHFESCHRVTSYRFVAKKCKQMFKILIYSLLVRPQGTQGCLQIREKTKNSILWVSDATMRF